MEKGGKNIMGIPNEKNILRLVSIFIALSMIGPGLVLAQGFKTAAPDMQTGVSLPGPTTYAWVNYNTPEGVGVLRDIGANIVSLRENGAYVKVTESQKNYLSTQFDLNDLPSRTVIDLAEQGIRFDSQAGYDLPAELRKADTNEYMVQFVVPTEESWNSMVTSVAGKILREIGDNVVVVKMTPAQKDNIENLDYVQWVGAYEPGYKLDKDIPSTGTVKLQVYNYEGAGTSELIAILAALGATEIEDTNYGSATCYIDASQLQTIAALDSVMLVDNLPEMKLLNNVGGRISQAQDLWVQTVSNLPQRICGQGQTIHVQDTAVDATHRDFINGPLGNRLTYETGTDAQYHGTHVIGIAAGNGYDMEAYLGLSIADNVYNALASTNPAGKPDRMGFAGRAPEASIYSRAGLVSSEWSLGYTAGARIFTNSWGPMTIQNGYDGTVDTFMAANTGALIFFAAGNDGPNTNSASGYGNCKLGVSVGAVENFRPSEFSSSDDPGQMASFSSRGPTSYDAIKPDVCEIGTAVFSTKSDDATEATLPGLYDTLNPINNDPDATFDYVSLQGTSMACPAAAGDGILIRDYLQDVKGIPTGSISANLIKTLLIHGAVDMGLGYPSMDQGWGRCNVRNSVCPPFPNVIQWYQNDAGIAAGTWSARTDGLLQTWVIDNTVPLKVTMTHWDATGSGTLTYDLDLVVTSPSGTRYEGNHFLEAWSSPCTGSTQWGGAYSQFPSWVGGGSYDYDTANDGGDDINNVEMFRIEHPEKGQWNVQVVWKSSTARQFTLAMTGGFNASADTNAANNVYKVNMNLDTPRVIPERDDFGEAAFKIAPSGSVIVPYWINNGGTTDDTYALSTPLLPAGFTVTLYPASPVSIASSARTHGYARILCAAGTTAGTYTLSIRATSNNDASAPIAQSEVKFQLDVVTTETPPTINIATTPAHEDMPAFVSWNATGTYYIGCAYRQDSRFGDRVYFKLSSDGGATWGTAIAVSPASWQPGYVSICRATSGTYAGRIMIAYNAWVPGGVGGNTELTTCAYIKVAYADSPYTTWTTNVNAFSAGEGRSAGNIYRTVNIAWYNPGALFMLVVETMGYTSTTPTTMNDVSCAFKTSANGGGTWSAIAYVDTNGANLYFFFPSVGVLPNGNIFVYFYERDAADSAQDRDASFREYNGAWGTYYIAWDTTDNVMFPLSLATTQGANHNRRQGFYFKGANTDGDMTMYTIYSDTGTTWTTNIQVSTLVLSQHDYGTRKLVCSAYQTGLQYVIAARDKKSDPYGQPNLLAFSDLDWAAAPVLTTDYLTLDSYFHSMQACVNTTNGGIGKVFVGQQQQTKSGSCDILGMHIYANWAAATDIWGPITEYVSADKTVCFAGDLVTVVANVQDWTTGGSNIAAAEYKTDVSNVTGVAMQTFDGTFNSPAEAVQSTATPINTGGWSTGWHWIFVRGQDAAGNWGAWVGIQIYVNQPLTATALATGPLGTSNVEAVTLTYDWTGVPTSVQLYYTKNTANPWTWVAAGAADTSIDGSFAYTIAAGDGTYGWYARAIGGSSTETAPTTATPPEATPYILDNAAPNAPTAFTVHQYGLGTQAATETLTTTGTTAAGGPHNVYFCDVDDNTPVELTTPNSATEWSDTYYTDGGTSNDVRAGPSIGPLAADEMFVKCSFATSVAAGAATQIDLTFEAQYNLANCIATMYAWDGTTWDAIGTTMTFTTANTDYTMTRSITTTVSDYIQGGVILWGVYGSLSNTLTCSVDFLQVYTTYNQVISVTLDNTLNWTASSSGDVDHYNIYRSAAGTDAAYSVIGTVPVGTNTYEDNNYGTADGTLWWYYVTAVDIATNEGTGTTHTQEPGSTAQPYNISLTGKAINSWVFVSFPIAISGNIQTILDDSVLGDGGTTWTVAKWCSAQDVMDPWKTYRVGSTVNDLTTISNAIGVWLWITANGGDQNLTTSLAGGYSASPVVINLYAGWNMVGYPTATSMAESATLPANADFVAVWQAATPYITQHAKGATMMVAGNAYWVHVTADCPWTVQP